MSSSGRFEITEGEWQRAYDLQNEYDSLTDGQAGKLADRLVADCRASGWVKKGGLPDIYGYAVDFAENNPVEPGGNGKPFAFWSYQSAPGPSKIPASHRFLAQSCAEARGFEVLETTASGKSLTLTGCLIRLLLSTLMIGMV